MLVSSPRIATPALAKGEERHDQEGRPGLQRVLDAEHRSLGLLGGVLQLPEGGVVLLGAGILAIDRAPFEVVHDVARSLHEGVRVEACPSGDREGQQHACDRGVDARLEDRHPEGDAEQAVDERATHAEEVGQDEHDEDDAGRRQRGQRQVGRCRRRAMTSTASRSSTMASAARKTRRPMGMREPRMARTPSAKAMSVAMGMPQPRLASPPPTMARKMTAGTIAPPTAATIGSVARRTEASSPTSTSRLISRPTTRKKMAMRPSLIQWSSDCEKVQRAERRSQARSPRTPPTRPTRASWPAPWRPRRLP